MYIEKGFSLVEVLVSSLMIMLGVTGYVTLQSEYVIADRNLNLRYLAMQLAEDKLNDLSYYEQLISQANKRAYKDIESNAGGNIVAGVKSIRLSNNASDVHLFELDWIVSDLFYVDSNFDDIADLWVSKGEQFFPKVEPLVSDLKKVNIKVKWLELGGSPQQIILNSYIAPIPVHNSFKVLFKENSIDAVP
ncbi:type IV pilus modification PilV family protein [Paraglaciecola sp.]|uniref:type IV pilus modification PilV family protein n=1 Tax=Paraglaciecola sp. TaxID=1920173 RepID=UPI003EF7946D